MITQVRHAQCNSIDMWHQMRVGLSQQRYYNAMKWVTRKHANVQQIHQINDTLQIIIWNVAVTEVISSSVDATDDDERSQWQYIRRQANWF